MTTTINPQPTGRAIRDGSGFGSYHAEVVWRDEDGDITDRSIACRMPHLWAGQQIHPLGWEGAVLDRCAPCAECEQLVPVPAATYGRHHRPYPIASTRQVGMGDAALTAWIDGLASRIFDEVAHGMHRERVSA